MLLFLPKHMPSCIWWTDTAASGAFLKNFFERVSSP